MRFSCENSGRGCQAHLPMYRLISQRSVHVLGDSTSVVSLNHLTQKHAVQAINHRQQIEYTETHDTHRHKRLAKSRHFQATRTNRSWGYSGATSIPLALSGGTYDVSRQLFSGCVHRQRELLLFLDVTGTRHLGGRRDAGLRQLPCTQNVATKPKVFFPKVYFRT